MGRGVLRIWTIGAANTDETIAHNLSRVPNMVLIVDPGTSYVQFKRGTAAWTQQTITLQFSVTGKVVLWIV